MTATRPTTDEIFKFVLENGAELPDVKDIKCRVYGTGKDQVEEQSDDPCPHGKIIVNGRWGCLDCYKQIREKEVVWLNKLTDGERVARLKKLLEHNKRCWEKLGDWTPGGKRSTCCPRVTAEYFSFREEETRKHYDRWAEVRREMGYRGDWVKYVRFEPNFEKVNIGSHYHGGILCPQGRKINGTRLCKEHWQQNKKDISDLALERRGQRGKEFLRTGWLAEDMMGGFAANCEMSLYWCSLDLRIY